MRRRSKQPGSALSTQRASDSAEELQTDSSLQRTPIAVMLLCVITAVLAVWRDGALPPPKLLKAPADEYSETRARVHLERLVLCGVRTVGSKLQAFSLPYFSAAACNATLQSTTAIRRTHQQLRLRPQASPTSAAPSRTSRSRPRSRAAPPRATALRSSGKSFAPQVRSPRSTFSTASRTCTTASRMLWCRQAATPLTW